MTAQLDAKAMTVKTGTRIDATNIASASEEDDDIRPQELLGLKHKGRATVHGFKAHDGAADDTALVEEVAPFFAHHVTTPHSVVTAHLIDEAGQPTVAARDEIIAFFRQRL